VAGPRGISTSKVQALALETEDQLLKTVHRLRHIVGSGQEQGSEADGPLVNERRAALSSLLSRYSSDDLMERLPQKGGKLLPSIARDLKWLLAAERQPVAFTKTFDFGFSENPMSTPIILSEVAGKRREAARASAKAIEAEPERPFDASNDSLGTHLELTDPSLRSRVLLDTLVQLRAARRSEALIDSALVAPDDENKEKAQGRLGTSGTVAAFEQRLACQALFAGSPSETEREYALLRLAIAHSPHASVNGIYAARNTVALLPDYLGPGAFADPIDPKAGFNVSIYNAIHRNYSANTPKAVDHYLRERLFTGGPREARVEILNALIAAARAGSQARAKPILAELEQRHGYAVPNLAGKKLDPEVLKSRIVEHLVKCSKLDDVKEDLSPEGQLRVFEIVSKLHQAVVLDRPSIDEIARELFHAGPAWPEVARLVLALREGADSATLAAFGEARTALRKAFFATSSGVERQLITRLDRKVELLSSEVLGSAVDRLEKASDTDAAKELVLATESALRGVIASGLESMRARPKTAKTEGLADLLEKLQGIGAKKKTDPEALRSLFHEIHRSALEIADTLRVTLRQREAAIRFSDIDVELDPVLPDSLVKESPLHYLIGLAQRGVSLGAKAEVSGTELHFIQGTRVLSSVGPRVYRRVLQADDAKALKKYSPPPGPDDLVVLKGAHPDQIIYGGGLVLDAESAGPGYSHASVFARGHGLSAIALPHLADSTHSFFSQAELSGGIYVDDRAGSFVMKPLSAALAEGLVKEGDLPSLRPGTNLEQRYFDVTLDGERIQKALSKKEISSAHRTREVELLIPDLENKLGLTGPISFSDLAKLPLDLSRQLAGEKGAVLARLTRDPALKALGVEVPGGQVVPPPVIAALLKDAKSGSGSLYELWQGTLSDPEFSKSAKYRLGTEDSPGRLAELKTRTEKALSKLLLSGNKPTKRGQELLEALGADPALKGKEAWILRSSFTGEDRPNKSGAGQYSSFPNAFSPRQRLEGLIGVIASMWNEGAIEGNLASGIRLEHIFPSVVAQKCLAPTVSGVAISRGPHGGFQEVSYQAKPKFGGGVDGGAAEEGVLRKYESSLSASYPGKTGSLLDAKQQAKLRSAILAIEELFEREIEPGKKHAVDVEWAFVGQKLHILQARVITLE
jgi:hypothetical protein